MACIVIEIAPTTLQQNSREQKAKQGKGHPQKHYSGSVAFTACVYPNLVSVISLSAAFDLIQKCFLGAP